MKREGWCDGCKQRVEVHECGNCQGRACEDCVLKAGDLRCPWCNAIVGGDPNNCKVNGGGCGR